MASLIADNHLLFAILTGIVPTLIWLFLWLHISRDKPEPVGLILLCFILGAASVMIATALQKASYDIFTTPTARIIVWAGIEEVLKFIVFYIVIYKGDMEKYAIDPALYMITVALGFAALENVLYVLSPLQSFNVTTGLLTGGLRFFGSTLLHAIASCTVGIMIAYTRNRMRNLGILIGLAVATVLHASFNLFILKNDTASFLHIYGLLWIVAIISHIMLEKLRRLPLMPDTQEPK